MTDKEKDLLLGVERRRRIRAFHSGFDRPEQIGWIVCSVMDDLALKVLKNKEVKVNE